MHVENQNEHLNGKLDVTAVAVELTDSKVRRERMGHIELAAPGLFILGSLETHQVKLLYF